MGAKSNASTTGKTAQDSKPMTLKEWECPHYSLTNMEDMLIAVFGDTAEARLTCIYCGNLLLPSSDRNSLAKNQLLKRYKLRGALPLTMCRNIVT